MELSKQDVVNNVQDLISLPGVYIKVQELFDDPNSSINDFAEVVSYDPALMARILRIVNSAFFGFATKIESISRAISIMGIAQLHDLVLATSAIDTFQDIPDNIENMDNFWRRSIFCGVIAQLIGSKCNSLDSERYFVIGLFHYIGHLVLCIQLPQITSTAIERSRTENTPLFQIEREMMGFDYAEIGSELLKLWHLPEAFIESIDCHLNPAKATNFPLESASIHIASILSMMKQLGPDADQQIPPFSGSAWELTGLNQDDIGAIQSEGERHFEEALALLRV